jgi:hypothetical protein
MSRYWPPIIPSVASARSRADVLGLVRQREPESLREKRIAREQRDALPESDVSARSAAALVVVVHRRQVVVDEREGVHQLERCRGRERIVDRRSVASATARQSTGRTRLPPDSSE